ncbi:hypothetical protein M9Y10_029382 [Tritrichomonas musculus]|uniref:DUF559 domain-containing protein n=1 Tax=Tritrichomonas musculus TaxID=1915356 RepID=A0ABR2KM53_9EUKA
MNRTRWNTQMVANEMAKENCILISEYHRGDERIKYTYENNEYSVRWYDWMKKERPSRPHLKGGNRDTKQHQKWNKEKVNELFQKEGCELIDEYRSTKQKLKYKYNDSYYKTTLDDWIHHQSRPHLFINENEQKFRKYLENKHIEFQTQKTFEGLKSKNNYLLRFDFYIPEINLLVEIDDRSHRSNIKQVENSKLKDEYCREHKIKLLRIDEAVYDDEYDKALDCILENDIYVLKYGRLYKQYNGIYKE